MVTPPVLYMPGNTGKLDVRFDADGVVTQCSGHPYLPIGTTFTYAYNGSEDRTLDAVDAFTVTQQLTADDDVVSTVADSNSAAILAGYDQVADVLRQTVIGTISEDLCLERIPGQGRSSICDVSDTTVHGSDISNIVAKAFMTITPTADIAIQNGGGVRVDVASGDYTIADAYSLLPFANTMATLEMTGQQIKNVLEDAFDYALSEGGSTGSYPYASGLRFDVDASQAKGSRFSNLEVNSRVAGDWGALDLAATYTVVTNNYIAAGQDGYTTFAEITGMPMSILLPSMRKASWTTSSSSVTLAKPSTSCPSVNTPPNPILARTAAITAVAAAPGSEPEPAGSAIHPNRGHWPLFVVSYPCVGG